VLATARVATRSRPNQNDCCKGFEMSDTHGNERVFLTVPEVALASGLSEKTVRRAIARGELRAMKLCNRMRITRDDMDAWHAASVVAASERLALRAPRKSKPRRPPAQGGLREMIEDDREDPAA
jgi:excisionase family DNA binding protein